MKKAIYIDVRKKKFKIEEVDYFGPVDFAVDHHHPELFTFGCGPLVATNIPGSHRLIFVNHSMLWDDLYISTLSGAAIELFKFGVYQVIIEGKADKYSILKLKDGKCNFIEIPKKNLEKIFTGYKKKKGTHALQQYVYDKFAKEYLKNKSRFRILTVGPAALKTNFGAICSTLIQGGKFVEGMDSWAGRGGFGSVLTQKHKVVAIIFGGNYEEDSVFHDFKRINELFMKVFNKPMSQVVMDATTKYRYDDTLKTGGTFGVNFTTLQDWFLSFNWTSVYMSDDVRTRLYEKMIKNFYLKQFNEEVIKPKSFSTCGEPCSAVCKKMYKKYKKDYEPYEANGPNLGVFDQRAAEKLVYRVDELGFDAIEIGNMVSWIMEMIDKNVIDKRVFGIKKKPKFELKHFDKVKDSAHNATLGMEILEMLISEKGELFANGIRQAAKKLGKAAMDLAVYTPNRTNGCITPCMYWVPAFFAPIPIQGKFLSDYSTDFKPPFEFGRSCAERFIKELYSDNSGICRFHRKWSEKIIQVLVNDLFNLNIDYYNHHKNLAKKINNLNKTRGEHCWESKKVIDIIHQYLEKLYRADKKNKILELWVTKFRQNPRSAAKQYWDEILKGFESIIL